MPLFVTSVGFVLCLILMQHLLGGGRTHYRACLLPGVASLAWGQMPQGCACCHQCGTEMSPGQQSWSPPPPPPPPQDWAFINVVERRIPYKVNIKVYYGTQSAAMWPIKLVASQAAWVSVDRLEPCIEN